MKVKKSLAIILSVVMLLCMLPTFAFAANVVTVQVSDGVPVDTSGSGWMYNAVENTVYLYNGGDFAFSGDTVSCNINSNSNITDGVFSGEVYSLGGKISGGTYTGTVKSRFDTITGGMFIGAFDSVGSTVTGGIFGNDVSPSSKAYTVTILNGYIKGTDISSVKVFPGTTVYIESNSKGESFANWLSFSDVPVNFADAKSDITSFVMPEGDVSIIAADVTDDYNPDIDNDNDGDIDFDDIIPPSINGSLNGIISTILDAFFGVMQYVIELLSFLF